MDLEELVANRGGPSGGRSRGGRRGGSRGGRPAVVPSSGGESHFLDDSSSPPPHEWGFDRPVEEDNEVEKDEFRLENEEPIIVDDKEDTASAGERTPAPAHPIDESSRGPKVSVPISKFLEDAAASIPGLEETSARKDDSSTGSESRKFGSARRSGGKGNAQQHRSRGKSPEEGEAIDPSPKSDHLDPQSSRSSQKTEDEPKDQDDGIEDDDELRDFQLTTKPPDRPPIRQAVKKHLKEQRKEEQRERGDDGSDSPKDEEEEDEEEEEEEEQDPVFKYHKLESSLSKIFENHSASCLCVHDKFVILGTHEGTLHVLDFNGNEVKTLPPHHVCVRDISVDANGEFVGSCSMGGLVNIHALYKEEKFQFAYERPLNSIALDPQYSKRSSRQFISGGKEGKLTLHSKGWFSTKENIIHSGEGTIYAIKWHKEYIAWANSEGVKVIDLSSMTKIVMIPRPKSVDIADLYRCCLVWHEYEDPLSTDSSSKKTGIFRGSGKRPLILELMVGWGDMVFVGRLEEYAVRQQARPTGSALMTSHPASGQTIVKKRMVPVSSFIVDCLVCGIAPFEEGILVLSNGDIFKEDTAITPSSKGTKGAPKSQPPVLRIFARDGEEVSSDELPVANFERNSPMDYRLEYYEGDLSYYILSLRDVIVARERTPDERIQWLLSKSKFERALEAAEAVVDQLQEVTLAQIGEKCMLHLMKENHYARAANYLPRVAKSDPEVWKKWIFAFGQSGMLRMILRKIPTATTMEDGTVLTLDQSTYAYVISTLMKKDPKSLLWVLETWPAEGILDPIVTAKNVSAEIDFLKTQLVQHKPVPDQSGVDKKKDGPEDIGNLLDKNSISVPTHIDILMDCLAELYIRTDNYGKALDIFLTLKKPKVFSFIEDHNLFHSVTHKVSALMELNPELSLAMFVRNLNDIDTRSVVSQLESKPEYIHRYLDAVFEKDATHASEFHEMQVELYAKYDKEKLLRFLQKSHFYPLEKACKICEERKLWEEAVFVLGRMGNLQEALSMIFREIKSVQKAIEFVEEHPDDELWEDLMNHCLKNGESIGELLDHFNPNIDPIVVIRKIPQGMKIPRLRDRLVRIITDYSLQRSLKEGCRAVLESDCMALAKRLMWLQTRAHFVKPRELVCSVCQMSLFDERRKGSIVAFACGHVYHALCLRTQATDDDKGRTGPQRIVSPGPPTSSRSRMICVVCHQEDPTETHEPRGHRKRG
eukprot:TRINITY_DN236_c1_g2_i1.p1 TRINITY_DN236_c1_g2~~TRINITY_DN236_c1_g2_i1.p1  ORF type:complete len:1216 (-),score=394.06 TRINITY_DN236_c1_g2_i1:274-3921(-)